MKKLSKLVQNLSDAPRLPENIDQFLEDNYFYHDSSPTTSSVQVLNDIHHWLTSGSLIDSVGTQTIDTLQSYE